MGEECSCKRDLTVRVILRYSRSMENGVPSSHIYGVIYYESKNMKHYLSMFRKYLRMFPLESPSKITYSNLWWTTSFIT